MITEENQKTLSAVCEAIAETMTRSGRKVPKFTENDRPIDEYDGFDSLCGVEVTLLLEELLGVEDLGTNIFVIGIGKKKRAATVSEIVDRVCGITRGGGA